jgi:hypothetical protein
MRKPRPNYKQWVLEAQEARAQQERKDRELREVLERAEQGLRRSQKLFDDLVRQMARLGMPEAYEECLKVLGLVPPVTRIQIRTAYLNLAKVHHPDAGGNADEFRRIETAYSSVLAKRPE